MKNAIKGVAATAVLAASSLLFARSAHAGTVTVNTTWDFNDVPGHCDSTFDPDRNGGGCWDEYGWWTGGRAGYDKASGNGFLWLSHDQAWNSWNTVFTASFKGQAEHGVCVVKASYFSDSQDPWPNPVGEIDLWEETSNGLVFLDSDAIPGTGNKWVVGHASKLMTIDKAVQDGGTILLVFGRHQGQSMDQFTAFDDVNVTCSVF
jgi:hypothetical protein